MNNSKNKLNSKIIYNFNCNLDDAKLVTSRPCQYGRPVAVAPKFKQSNLSLHGSLEHPQ